MEYVIGTYIVLGCIFSFNVLKQIPEGRSSILALVIGLSWGIPTVLFLLSFLYKIFGINLEFNFSINLTEEETKKMTDDQLNDLSDRLRKMMEEQEDEDEK